MTTPTSAGNLYVFDALVPELQVLVSKVPAGAQVLIIEEGADGFQQLAQFVSSQTELDSIHLISHGSDGQVRLGSSTLSLGTMNQFSADLEAIGKSLSDSGDLLIYGCNVAQGSAGQQLISEIGAISGADVAASTGKARWGRVRPDLSDERHKRDTGGA
jgi:hypothetical protein